MNCLFEFNRKSMNSRNKENGGLVMMMSAHFNNDWKIADDLKSPLSPGLCQQKVPFFDIVHDSEKFLYSGAKDNVLTSSKPSVSMLSRKKCANSEFLSSHGRNIFLVRNCSL